MANKISSILVVLVLVLIFFTSFSMGMDVNKILSNYSDYGTFNHLLDATGLSGNINSRQTITLLALDNGACGSLQGRPVSEAKAILMNHVILDYYDESKLNAIKAKRSTLLTTLYQTTGMAKNNQGSVNVTVSKSGDIMFGSGAQGSPLESKYLGSVMSNPFNISILHVSQPVVDHLTLSPSQSPTTSTTSPSSSPTDSSPPTPSRHASGPHNGKHAADGPADGPTSDSAKAPAPSSSSMVNVGSSVGVLMVIGLLMNLVGF
ncbi:hypothetical protein ACFE04_002615 [Oxalis oulophora]